MPEHQPSRGHRIMVGALLAGLALLTASCTGGGATTAPDGTVEAPTGNGGQVSVAASYVDGTNIPAPLAPAEITWLHNGVTEPLRSYWEQVAQDFMALHPGVVVTFTAVDNQQLRSQLLPSAFDGEAEPDLFQSWGGGELTYWVNQGAVMNLSQVLAPTVASLGAAASTWEVGGQPYGLPYAMGPAGFWVNLNLLNDAGLVQNPQLDAQGNVTAGTVDWPTTFDGLYTLWQTLRDHGITPVAVGGGSGWASAWWYYAMVSQTCPPAAVTAAGAARDFSDPCWEQAGANLRQVIGQGAFNDGWETMLAQGGADSAAGLVVNGQAAMEFTGPWGGLAMASDWAGGTGAEPGFISWYPLPALADGQGAGTVLVGGDGFSVLNPTRGSEARSNAAAALLAYILSDPVQAEGIAFNYHGQTVHALPATPTNPAVISQLTDPVSVRQAETVASANFTMQWLDTYLGQTIGTALNDKVNAFMRGAGSPADIVTALNNAAGNY